MQSGSAASIQAAVALENSDTRCEARMASPSKCDRYDDPFRPPEIPTMVGCLHCGEQYDSYLIEWREMRDTDGHAHGFWCCPTPGCDGAGFGFDILPTDPFYRDEHGGWVHDDDDADELSELEDDASAGFDDDAWDDDIPF